MTLLFVVVAIALVGAVAVLVVRDQPVVDDDPVDPRRLSWPPPGRVGPADIGSARFTVALRGYRMDEVDRVLADAATALAERDARITELEAGRPPGPAQAGTSTVSAGTDSAADPALELVLGSPPPAAQIDTPGTGATTDGERA